MRLQLTLINKSFRLCIYFIQPSFPAKIVLSFCLLQKGNGGTIQPSIFLCCKLFLLKFSKLLKRESHWSFLILLISSQIANMAFVRNALPIIYFLFSLTLDPLRHFVKSFALVVDMSKHSVLVQISISKLPSFSIYSSLIHSLWFSFL